MPLRNVRMTGIAARERLDREILTIGITVVPLPLVVSQASRTRKEDITLDFSLPGVDDCASASGPASFRGAAHCSGKEKRARCPATFLSFNASSLAMTSASSNATGFPEVSSRRSVFHRVPWRDATPPTNDGSPVALCAGCTGSRNVHTLRHGIYPKKGARST